MPYYIKRKSSSRSKSTLSKAIAKLDKVFSLYIRLRDSKPFGYKAFRCISCGKIKPFHYADCGHYYSRTHMATRFDEDNCHAECSYCNRFKADHLIGYQANLIKKIGKENFDLLTLKAHSSYRWSLYEIEERIKFYKAQIAEMQKEKWTNYLPQAKKLAYAITSVSYATTMRAKPSTQNGAQTKSTPTSLS